MREPQAGDLGPLLLVLDQDAYRLRVLEDVRGVLRRAVRVDRGADRADSRQRVVEERPVERRLRQDSERVPFAHAERQQSVRELVDRLAGLCPGDLDPALRTLAEVSGLRAPGRHGAAPELPDRPLHAPTLRRRLPAPTKEVARASLARPSNARSWGSTNVPQACRCL